MVSTVSVAPEGPADQSLAGTLCLPNGRSTSTLLLLLPGGTYDQSYWSLRGDPEKPSFVEAMTETGYATLAIDLLGTGLSSRPHSDQFALTIQEVVVHQLITRLRRGEIGSQPFSKVVLVGNSFGSTVARVVAISYPDDIDGLILTGESNTPNWAAFETLDAAFLPANQDPRLADRGLDGGYVSIKQGAKETWLYHLPTADAGVIADDEAAPEPYVYPPDPAWGDVALNKQIAVPALLVVGEYDKVICGEAATDCSSSEALLAQQAPWYGPQAQLEAVVVDDTGHVLNLHRTAATWYADARDWLDRHIGTTDAGSQ